MCDTGSTRSRHEHVPQEGFLAALLEIRNRATEHACVLDSGGSHVIAEALATTSKRCFGRRTATAPSNVLCVLCSLRDHTL